MLVIGLTGGIGSGKTTVANLFAQLDIPIIDTDLIAREITGPHQPAYQAIIAHFGQTFALPDHTLNRAKLRTHIFADPKARIWLEQLLHPLIKSIMAQKIANVAISHAPYCIVIIPLLFEANVENHLDRILLVDAPPEMQLSRASARDQTTALQIQPILATQFSREKRLALADDVITNDADIQSLEKQVKQLHQRYTILNSKSKHSS